MAGPRRPWGPRGPRGCGGHPKALRGPFILAAGRVREGRGGVGARERGGAECVIVGATRLFVCSPHSVAAAAHTSTRSARGQLGVLEKIRVTR